MSNINEIPAMSIKKRETEKFVDIGERRFKIKKMDARLATYVAFTILNLLPAGGKNPDSKAIVMSGQSIMPRHQFFDLQNDCLSVCFMVMPAGEHKVIDKEGQFVDAELTHDFTTVVMLIAESLAFNVTDFFDSKFLKEFTGKMSTMIPSAAETPANS